MPSMSQAIGQSNSFSFDDVRDALRQINERAAKEGRNGPTQKRGLRADPSARVTSHAAERVLGGRKISTPEGRENPRSILNSTVKIVAEAFRKQTGKDDKPEEWKKINGTLERGFDRLDRSIHKLQNAMTGRSYNPSFSGGGGGGGGADISFDVGGTLGGGKGRRGGLRKGLGMAGAGLMAADALGFGPESVVGGATGSKALGGIAGGALTGAATGAVFGPWGAAIDGVAGGAMGAADHWEEIEAYFKKEMMTSAQMNKLLKDIDEGVEDGFKSLIDDLSDLLSKGWESIKEGARGFGDTIARERDEGHQKLFGDGKGGGNVDTSQGKGDPAANQKAFVDKWGPTAEKISQETGIPKERILAQAGLESGWRTDNGAGGNFFGIKAGKDYTGPSQVMATTEDRGDGRGNQPAMERFRTYANPEDSWRDWATVMRQKNFKSAMDPTIDDAEYAKRLKAGGYATDATYAQKLYNTIQNVRTITGNKDGQPPQQQQNPDGSSQQQVTVNATPPKGGNTTATTNTQEQPKTNNTGTITPTVPAGTSTKTPSLIDQAFDAPTGTQIGQGASPTAATTKSINPSQDLLQKAFDAPTGTTVTEQQGGGRRGGFGQFGGWGGQEGGFGMPSLGGMSMGLPGIGRMSLPGMGSISPAPLVEKALSGMFGGSGGQERDESGMMGGGMGGGVRSAQAPTLDSMSLLPPNASMLMLLLGNL